MEPYEAVEKLRTTVKGLSSFRSIYHEYKHDSFTSTPNNPWKFSHTALFSRLDAFVARCTDMQELQSTCLAFSKLDKVEMGGTRGKVLGTSVRQILTEFQHILEKFREVDYDVLDVDAGKFTDDFQ